MRDELQNKFAAEQQAAAKSQQAANELQERLNQVNVELERSKPAETTGGGTNAFGVGMA